MGTDWRAVYTRTVAHVRETATLASIDAVLGWDERTMLPAAAGAHRADQMTLLAGMIHARWTCAELGDWLEQLQDGLATEAPDSPEAVTLRRLTRQRERRVKLPRRLVEELARQSVLGQQAWVEARQHDDFARFQPLLQQTLELKREEADAVGHDGCRYDALLDEYEPGAKTAEMAEILGNLRQELVPLVAAIGAKKVTAPRQLLAREYPIEAQRRFAREVSSYLGFDYQRGRLDETAHPFCTTLGPHDCRITTRYDLHDFSNAFFGTLHEAGHGMYEQGLPADYFGLPLGEAVSLGIHESQSRLWENFVGRSRAFWRHFFPQARQAFPTALGDVAENEFYFAVNDVRPSLIRTESDEATYNLHICVRFELEQELLDGQLPVAELPAAWNQRYREYVGIAPQRDADGVLQDVHWSAGLLGYFPTYTLGNLCAAQLFARADGDLGGIARLCEAGDFRPLLDWLRQHVHRHGQRYLASELIERATGRPLGHQALMGYLRSKLGPLYGLS